MIMNRLKERIYPLTLIAMGVYIAIIPLVLRVDLNMPYSTILAISQILILIGIFLYGFQELRRRLTHIENELEIDKENRVSKAKLISKDISNDFVNEIKRKKYIYKASIYLPSASMDNLFLIQNLLSNTKVDSKVRLLVNTYNNDDIKQNNLDILTKKLKSQIDLKTVNSDKNKHYSIIIIDTEIWIINDFGNEIEDNLLFSISSYNKQGKSFIELFNKLWEESKTYLTNNE